VGGGLDLFSAATADSGEGAWSVSQVTKRARRLIEAGLELLWVKGEVTGFKSYRSGHWYFTLRDADAQVRCVMWRTDNQRLPAPPVEGTQVFVEARPTVWEERGEFRLTVRQLVPTDAGGLWQLQLERAKAALARDGLLDPARKRALPSYPQRIAVVTSADGAALKDVISVMSRRWPQIELLVVPARVQGERAESSERVARAVAAVQVPTISAVGHETDVALTDLVADVRAATPSAAAEAAVPSGTAALELVDGLAQRMVQGLSSHTVVGRERLARTVDRLTHAIQTHVERRGAILERLGGKLDALSPLKVLHRGYAVARDDAGQVLKRKSDFTEDLTFRLTVSDGDVRGKVVGE
jgi:exodeoxyribonuclease VII large subunit